MRTLHQSLQIPAAGVVLPADVVVPEPAPAVVLFAHGNGSSRHSARITYVAAQLQKAGLATALVDLLTCEEARTDVRTREYRFNIGLLAERLVAVTDWVTDHAPTAGLDVGFYGASTGAAAALVAAAARPHAVGTVLSRGGRPDLAGEVLCRVHQPTMLMVRERDLFAIELNRKALRRLGGEARLEIVPHRSHHFAEPGRLEQMARLAKDWFIGHLRPATPANTTAPTPATATAAPQANSTRPHVAKSGKYL
jgi:putative phosphoribosyl transferase